MSKFLIIDDETLWAQTMEDFVQDLGHEARAAYTLAQGLELARHGDYDIVLLDAVLPDGSGLDHIAEIRAARSNPEVIIITGKSADAAAKLALEHRAWDYISKVASLEKIRLSLKRALEYRSNKRMATSQSLLLQFKRAGIVGESPPLLHCLEDAAKAAASELPVHVYGETGCGKELMARAIHANSSRSAGPFVVVDCASMPEALMESELFGHAKGAFTGAEASTRGLVARAHQGALFLDEIGELPLDMQQKLLRVLQEKRCRPLGASHEQPVDFRIISATNRDLSARVEEGGFREDLLYRLQAMQVTIPPLRERLQDIPPLITHFLSELGDTLRPKQASQDFLETLQAYDWPGNVRELRNVVGAAMALAIESDVLFPIHLPTRVRLHAVETPSGEAATPADTPEAAAASPAQDAAPVALHPPELIDWKRYKQLALRRAEQEYFRNLLIYTGWDKAQAMAIAGLSKAQFYKTIKGLDLTD